MSESPHVNYPYTPGIPGTIPVPKLKKKTDQNKKERKMMIVNLMKT